MVNRKQNLQFVLNDDYYKIFKPFYYVVSFFGLRTYNLKNGLAHPITKWNEALGILASFVVTTSLCLTLKWSNFLSSTTKAIYYIQYFLHVTIFLVQAVVNFYLKEYNFELLKKLQEIGKIIKNPEVTKSLSIIVWTFFIWISLYYVMFIYIRGTVDVHWIWPRALLILTAVLFEMSVLQVSLHMLYLALKLRKWKMMIKSYRVDEFDETNQMLKQLKSSFEMILVAYSMVKKSGQVTVLMCFIMAFIEFLTIEGLFFIWAGWERGRYGELSAMTIWMYGWMIKIVVIEVVLCVSCEIFYVEITRVREAVIIKTCIEDPHFRVLQSFENLKDFSKSISRTIDSHFTKMSACSVFTADAALFLRFLSTVATYTIVLLQFAFQI